MTFAFDNRAISGFARGEGVGVLVLKSVQSAIENNDRIRSVIVSSGVGQDGRTIGMYLISEVLITWILRCESSHRQIPDEQQSNPLFPSIPL